MIRTGFIILLAPFLSHVNCGADNFSASSSTREDSAIVSGKIPSKKKISKKAKSQEKKSAPQVEGRKEVSNMRGGLSIAATLGILGLIALSGQEAYHNAPVVQRSVDSIVEGADKMMLNYPSKMRTSVSRQLDNLGFYDSLITRLKFDSRNGLEQWFQKRFVEPLNYEKARLSFLADRRIRSRKADSVYFDATLETMSPADFNRISELAYLNTPKSWFPGEKDNTLLYVTKELSENAASDEKEDWSRDWEQSAAVEIFKREFDAIYNECQEYKKFAWEGGPLLDVLKSKLLDASANSSTRRGQIKSLILESMIKEEREKQISLRKPKSASQTDVQVKNAFANFLRSKSKEELSLIIRDSRGFTGKKWYFENPGHIAVAQEVSIKLWKEFPSVTNERWSKPRDVQQLRNLVKLVIKQVADASGNAPYWFRRSFSVQQQKSYFKDQIEVLSKAKEVGDFGSRFENTIRLAIAEYASRFLDFGIDWTVDIKRSTSV